VTPRQRERRLAFQVLYALLFHPTPSQGDLIRTFDNFCAELSGPDARREGSYAWSLVLGVWERQHQLDIIIAEHATGWKLDRIAKVERTILRLALYEMLWTDVPFRVAVNEAVELAKTFGEEGSRVFINGVLDAAGKALRVVEAPVP